MNERQMQIARKLVKQAGVGDWTMDKLRNAPEFTTNTLDAAGSGLSSAGAKTWDIAKGVGSGVSKDFSAFGSQLAKTEREASKGRYGGIGFYGPMAVMGGLMAPGLIYGGAKGVKAAGTGLWRAGGGGIKGVGKLLKSPKFLIPGLALGGLYAAGKYLGGNKK